MKTMIMNECHNKNISFTFASFSAAYTDESDDRRTTWRIRNGMNEF